MTFETVSESDVLFVEGLLDSSPDPEFVTSLIEACFASNAGAALVYANQLPEGFFDLSSRVAGEALQRLRNYDIRLAVVVPGDVAVGSSRFGEMVAEEKRGRHFSVFASRVDAILWLQTR